MALSIPDSYKALNFSHYVTCTSGSAALGAIPECRNCMEMDANPIAFIESKIRFVSELNKDLKKADSNEVCALSIDESNCGMDTETIETE